MHTSLLGLHHVTAVARNPRHNLEFYTNVLGLRLVKKTVDFDEPDTYHFYFGDAQGTPGTILTFFPWPDKPDGRLGTGQASAVAFAVPPDALGFWEERLSERGLSFYEPTTRFEGAAMEEQALVFRDEDGLCVELVEDHIGGKHADAAAWWESGGIAPDAAIRGLHSVTLALRETGATDVLLRDTLGFDIVAQDANRTRYALGAGGAGKFLDVLNLPGTPPGQIGPGTIHHVAWRVPDDGAEQTLRETLAEAGLDVTGFRDRKYFRSIYFDEPGGVLFEIATDPPGFTVDEPQAELGTGLQLPLGLESRREELLKSLPPL